MHTNSDMNEKILMVIHDWMEKVDGQPPTRLYLNPGHRKDLVRHMTSTAEQSRLITQTMYHLVRFVMVVVDRGMSVRPVLHAD
jgi:hypothetical protein